MVKTEDSRALLIFIKNPQKGKVKTRIAQSVGDDSALRIYKLLLDYTRSIASSLPITRRLYYSSHIEKDDWPESLYDKFVQTGDDLGERMSSAFQKTLKSFEKVVIIGSDCSQLQSDDIQEAFDQLTQNDVVIGPTLDGGYYLLGMKKYNSELFTSISWSTDEVFEQTTTKANQTGLKVGVLRTLSDIDFIEDWEEYGLD